MQNDLFFDAHNQDFTSLPMVDADIRYYPQLLSTEQAESFYTYLRDSLVWRQDHIKMYGKQVKIPRLQAWYGSPEAIYTYSGLTMDPNPWTDKLLQLKQLCEEKNDESLQFCAGQLVP